MSQVRLLDENGLLITTAHVADEAGCYGGRIDVSEIPADVRKLFDEYEEVVNGQMFAFLDDIEGKIADLHLRAVFEDGSQAQVQDLQIYPTTGNVSFRLSEAIAKATPVRRKIAN